MICSLGRFDFPNFGGGLKLRVLNSLQGGLDPAPFRFEGAAGLGRLPQLKRPQLFPVGFEPLGLFRLAVQRVHLPLDLADHVAQTQQVLLGGFHLPQGRGLAVLVFGDAGGFFD